MRKIVFKSGFQSTLPRRERRHHLRRRGILYHISIHAPAKGATNGGWDFARLLVISIHAPAKGATQRGHGGRERATISIHAPAKGATAFINIFSLAVRLFFISSHQ